MSTIFSLLVRTVAVVIISNVTFGAAALTPEELKALVDERAANTDPFQALLNDPDPVRSLAAIELMIESGEPHLVRMAVDFGLLSALPEVRRAATVGYLGTRPTLRLSIKVPEEMTGFDAQFRKATDGVTLPDGTASYTINIGPFDTEKNCFLRTGTEVCAAEISATGISITKTSQPTGTYAVRSNLSFVEDGTLSGATSVEKIVGSFPTTMQLTY